MGEHVCGPLQGKDSAQDRLAQYLKGPAFPAPKTNIAFDQPKQRRMLPPQIDPSRANRPYAQPGQIALKVPDPSGLNGASARDSPKPPLVRSATTPISQRRPSSPDITLPQDCAFPAFPTTRTNTLQSKSQSQRRPSDVASHPVHKGTPSAQTSRNGRPIEDPIKQMDSGTSRVVAVNGLQRGSDEFSHQRTGTLGSTKSTFGPFEGSGTNVNMPRPSTAGAGSERSAAPSFGSSGGPYGGSSRGGTGGGGLRLNTEVRPATASGHRESQPTTSVSASASASIASSKYSFPSIPSSQTSRSQTPVQMSNGGETRGASHTHTQMPSVGAHARSPSVAAANRPLDEIGSMSSFKAYKSTSAAANTTFGGLNLNASDSRSDPRVSDAPPVPIAFLAGSSSLGGFHHSPTESRSSNASSRSSTNTGSSRSSPPLSDAGFRGMRKGSGSNLSRDGLLRMEPLASNINTSFRPETPSTRSPPSFSRPLQSRNQVSVESVSKAATIENPPESPMDPSMQFGRLSPIPPPPSQIRSPQKQSSVDQAQTTQKTLPEETNPYNLVLPNQMSQTPGITRSATSPTTFLPLPISNTSASPSRRGTTANKGKCRGCDHQIVGKSVSSADGRLTGRYHKDCFVCKTCKEPFKTTDFYVMNNEPYCSRHYHVLNGSLCKTCDFGIEGQYLETKAKQKFHPNCFTCRDCRKVLGSEYFEFGRAVYCEQHAFRAAQASSLLAPPGVFGRRHPEKRTTKLMMMA
ncbi:hypothetical protein MMC25_002420 [Agyrium rufum]|nr:hypothetical protein [Agyrium rufum]